MAITASAIDLKLVDDSGYYGKDRRAINRHRDLTFQDEQGRLFQLSKTLDGIPPFYEAYGPYDVGFVGIMPRLKVEEKEYWGDGLSWKQAKEKFFTAITERQRSYLPRSKGEINKMPFLDKLSTVQEIPENG